MFEIGWTEMLVIAVVMIVVVGPKDLPRMLRTFGKMTAKLRGMAGDFQKQFNEAMREADLDEVKKSVDSLKSLNPANEIRKQLNPLEKAAAEIRAGVDAALKPKPAEVKPAATSHATEPLKNGATAMPGVEGPAAMPEPPLFPADEAAPAVPAVNGTAVADGTAVNGAAVIPAAAASVAASASPAQTTSAPAVSASAAPAASSVPSAPAPAASEPKPARAAARPRAVKPKATEAEAAAPKKAARKPSAKKPAEADK